MLSALASSSCPCLSPSSRTSLRRRKTFATSMGVSALVSQAYETSFRAYGLFADAPPGPGELFIVSRVLEIHFSVLLSTVQAL